ncbi:phosphogluconate dehydratase [Microbulbifer thermotolerans]|uniref:Phosphogluconate dehydratase n=1 Tax=Microbulbifer thermotolerans TaxID=252514 RepID=A0A143HKG9_MICTH|nr:phosphogluconate dehydratase [Microbulbifer thermotolerans]AMX01987.1 phosphogluconate dehydratase [Microbulbifer thermotolerans]MCX2780553.1 phosphogluconate dehydratase [Microbulbifer thermotolerans]MCX2783150.1 phosphogluconate dehydratase [Microbulbifer thermotolerans]MCX2794248.1 phosphogluconate dehydratase [Microbulbifer thermotolerans]MCX2800730.1 phosphogluconate dehydratase [Microbulbifer thermotolerans]
MLHSKVQAVTERIIERSEETRAQYLAQVDKAHIEGRASSRLSCGNLAHAIAASDEKDKNLIASGRGPNLAIVTAYNDMLSAHQPYGAYPSQLKEAAARCGATAQVAGGVPAMCDGVTQGRAGMELSLFSRDVIAMSTAIALSHDVFEGAMYLGICDKIVPGLVIGALAFGHLPAMFVPAGPMPTGLANAEKVRVRQLFAEGKVGRKELLEAESASYHSPGTCTFYGTANSNQMLVEIMGLQLPGSSFVNPGTELRQALNGAAVEQLVRITEPSQHTPIAKILTEKAFVNGIVGLLATGGSTNHTLHLVAMARAAGIQLTWQDMAELSEVVPLLCRVYPNGTADINHFAAAGGMQFLIRELLGAGLLHADVHTVLGDSGLEPYCRDPFLNEDKSGVVWRPAPETSGDPDVIRPVNEPFSHHGGLQLLEGNLGRSVIKVSALKPENLQVKAPAVVFHSQDQLLERFKAGELEKDFVAVVRFQGPQANGMPELHKLTPTLGVLQDRGFKVALITDGRMSGASGKVPAAIHMSPEAVEGGPIAKVRDGDLIELDADAGILRVLVDDAELAAREPASGDLSSSARGTGRELFANMRSLASGAESGASILY